MFVLTKINNSEQNLLNAYSMYTLQEESILATENFSVIRPEKSKVANINV